jgi:hypothetical protein
MGNIKERIAGIADHVRTVNHKGAYLKYALGCDAHSYWLTKPLKGILPREKGLNFPRFYDLVKPLSSREAENASYIVEGDVPGKKKDSPPIHVTIPEDVCEAIGLTKENATPKLRLKGSEHTSTYIDIVHVRKKNAKGRWVEGNIAIKHGPEVGIEPETAKLARESHIGIVTGLVLADVNHTTTPGRKGQGERTQFIAMPAIPMEYRNIRDVIDSGEMKSRAARRMAKQVTVFAALGARERYKKGNFEGERTSMQLSEEMSYYEGLQHTAEQLVKATGEASTAEDFRKKTLVVQGDNGNLSVYHSIDALEERMGKVLDRAKYGSTFVAEADDEDNANKNFHVKKNHFLFWDFWKVVARVDWGYAATEGKGTILPIKFAISQKTVTPKSVISIDNPTFNVIDSAVIIPDLHAQYQKSALAYEEQAQLGAPFLAEQVLGRVRRGEKNEFLAQEQEHLAVNRINTMRSLAASLESVDKNSMRPVLNGQERKRQEALLLNEWISASKHLKQADALRGVSPVLTSSKTDNFSSSGIFAMAN